ncbi:longevity assurance proteins LAG1/LAC1 [Delitschia confertaspora ATCC 74209]|uniref:Longevity assurance proteins LAG1/LAC1 n=1 Tax=Delitschia confertaspora ATCC 74209 TaxID=1513339 RepID=A0A9P4JK30_9PLEO|nr:longevity assurance proteins LAG1/LAC1 [Delitschia confertaspora ATCC 74209]
MVTKKRVAKDESLLGSLCALICDHQIGISVNLILLLSLAHICFPRARWRTSKFLHLSYYNPTNGLYGSGNDDIPFVALWIVIFTFLRAAVMDYILHPLARAGGIKSRKGSVRFCEQAWLLIYYSIFWTLGMYLMYHSDYWFDLKGLWTGWPHREVNGLFKWYYLVQFAFWIQQILVVNIEEKRKDYAQMFTHHIITSALMLTSYGYYHMRVGSVILCIMDVVDIILPVAKLMKYLGYKTAPDIAFGVFMAVWVIARHVFYLMVCWSIYAHTPEAMTPGCHLASGQFIPATSSVEYEALGGNKVWSNILQVYLNRDGPVCWNPVIRWSFLGLLLTLQALTLLWFAMIVRVAWRVIQGAGADDVRSDDEEDEEEEIEAPGDILTKPAAVNSFNGVKLQPEWTLVEEEVGVESLSFARRTSPGVRRGSYKRREGRASGISIPGHGDRKELLGRIGCDKPT